MDDHAIHSNIGGSTAAGKPQPSNPKMDDHAIHVRQALEMS